MRIINKKYNIKGNIDANIVLISDIHYINKNDIKHLNKVLDNIKKINPNYICIPGDIINNTYINDEDILVNWFKDLSKISPVIISIGNHELCISKKKRLFGFNKDLYNKISSIKNIYVLDNDNIVIDNINFIGLSFPAEYYYKYKEEVFDSKYLKNIKINKKYYNILLCHSPINIINHKIDVDLILCGHTHGGIVPHIFSGIIKHGGFISPCKSFFPKNVYGHIHNIIITSGISVLPKNLGILTNLIRSEVVNIKIER